MSKHYAQRSMSDQMDRVKELIIKVGGLRLIENKIGVQHFQYFVAGEIGCTPRKAKEYVDIIRRSAIARARIEEITGKNVAEQVS